MAKDQHIEQLDPQTIEVTAEILDSPQLQRWLSSFGPDLEVLFPEVLRMAMAERHQQATLYSI